MIKTIVVDDRQTGIDLVKNWLSEEYDFTIVAEARDLKSAKKEILKYNPDLVFLDVQFDGFEKSGIDLIVELEKIPYLSMTVVFMTAYSPKYKDKYVSEVGVRFNKMFLKKPLEYDDLSKIANDVRLIYQHNTMRVPASINKQIEIQHGRDILFLNPDEIFYISTIKDVPNLVSMHLLTHEKEIILSSSLTQLMKEKLPEELFYKVSGNTIVNRGYLRKTTSKGNNKYSCTVEYGDKKHEFGISQNAYSAIKNMLPKY